MMFLLWYRENKSRRGMGLGLVLVAQYKAWMSVEAAG
jgi:hypothetical protein